MQFEPATFAQYAVNADPPAKLTPYNPADAIYTAAAMLCANGAASGTQAGIRQAIYAYNHAQCVRHRGPGLGRPLHRPRPQQRRRGRDRVRGPPGRQALPVGRHRPGRLRLLGPGLRRLRRRGHPHRPHHLPVAPGRPADPADPDPARRPAVLRRLRRHPRQPGPRRDVPRRRPDHPGPADRRGRPDRPPRPGRGRRRHPSRRPRPCLTHSPDGGLP